MTSKESVTGWKLQQFPPLKIQPPGWEKQTGEDQRPISFSGQIPVITQKDCISVISAQLVSVFNWSNSRRLHLPVGIGWYFPLNYQYFSPAPSAYVSLTCRAPGFSFPYRVLLVAAGWWVHLPLQHLEYFHLEIVQSEMHRHVSDTYQTSWFLFVWKQNVFLICQFLSDSDNSHFRWVRESQKPGHAAVIFAVKAL